MSRIYRSLDPQPGPFVKQVDIRQTTLVSQALARPSGGFFGAKALRPGQPPLSLTEQRERQAHLLIEEAKSRAEAIQREAYHAGFDEGERAGRKLAMQKVEPAMQTLSEMVQAISRERDALQQQHRADLLKIAFLIAEQVVHKQIEMDPETVVQIVEAALQKVAKNQKVILAVAPQDLPILEHLIKEGRQTFLASEHVRLVADDAVSRGGCRVTADTGDVDATIEGQLRVVGGALW